MRGFCQNLEDLISWAWAVCLTGETDQLRDSAEGEELGASLQGGCRCEGGFYPLSFFYGGSLILRDEVDLPCGEQGGGGIEDIFLGEGL